MKLTKFFIMFFILTISFIACKVSKLEVTKPDFKGDKTISKGDTNYNLTGTYGYILGIYEEVGNRNSYLVALPDVGDIKIDKEQKKALDEIVDTVGMDNIGSIISGVTNSKDGNIDIDKVVGSANISDDKKNKVKDLIEKNFKDKKFEYTIYGN